MKLNRNTYRKLLLCFCSVLTFSLLGCSGDSYPGLVYDDSHGSLYDMNSENSGRMPVTIFLDRAIYLSGNGGGSTRADGFGTGPWDEYIGTDNQRHHDETWRKRRKDNTRFGLYSFREKMEANPPLNVPTDLSVKFANDIDNVHCLIDNTANALNPTDDGLMIKITDEEEGIQLFRTLATGMTEPMYWSTKYQQTGYNFSMYHIDDLGTFDYNATRTRLPNQIYYDFKINGQHDVMYGKAERPTDSISLIQLQPLAQGLTTAEKKNIVEYGFSTYAAHRNVNPKIKMSHCLTRLQFVAYPGDSTVNYIKVTGIEVESKVNARLLVASTNAGDELGLQWRNNDMEYVSVGEWNEDSTLVKEFSEFRFAPTDYDKTKENFTQQINKPVGAPIMVSQEGSFNVKVKYRQEVPERDANGNVIPERDASGNIIYDEFGIPKVKMSERDLSTPYRISPPSGQSLFKAGYIYTISLVIYGLAGIKVQVEINPWVEGGKTEPIEPDYGFEAKPLSGVTPLNQGSNIPEARK